MQKAAKRARTEPETATKAGHCDYGTNVNAQTTQITLCMEVGMFMSTLMV
jgi:hypothetical protein